MPILNNIDYKRIFFKFLKEKDAYDRWAYNLKSQCPSILTLPPFWSRKKRFLFSNDCSSVISAAFTWSITPEGREFWETLDEEWNILCNNIKRNKKLFYKNDSANKKY